MVYITPIIPALRSKKGREFEASLGYIVSKTLSEEKKRRKEKGKKFRIIISLFLLSIYIW